MLDFSKYDDEQLVRLLTENDETAFSEIYSRYWKPLYISVQNILHDTDPSQDVVQEVFISLWQRRHTAQIADECHIQCGEVQIADKYIHG